MSITVNSRPATWSGTSNPILYKLNTTTPSNAGYYLLVQIWNSTTASKIGEAKFYPKSNGDITVRVEQFLKAQMSLDNNSDLSSGSNVYIDNNWIKYYIKYQEFWTGSATSLNDDVANLRFAVYGGLQIGSSNDFASYLDAKFLTNNSLPSAIANYPFLIEGIFATTGDFVLSRYKNGVELSATYYPVASVGVNRLKFKETGSADSFSVWKQGTSVPGFSSGSTASNFWTSVTYGAGLFVAVSNTGTNRVMTSPDGVTWTNRSCPSKTWSSVAYGNGVFVAVTNDGFGDVMTSRDGITWTLYSGAAAAGSNAWSNVTYGNGLFVAVCGGIDVPGTGVITSPNGINWTVRSTPIDPDWNSVCYGNGLFVAVATNGTDVITSPDGIRWTQRSHGIANAWTSVTWGCGLFVAVSKTGTGNRVMTSPDGITWTSRTSAGDFDWNSVDYFSGIFLAVAETGTASQRAMFSKDGITWSLKIAATSNDWKCIAACKTGSLAGTFVAVSSTGSGNRAMKASMIASEVKIIEVRSGDNVVMLQWKNSLGGDECYPFTFSQEYYFAYSEKKAKRLNLFANNLTLDQWEAIQGLNTPGIIYSTPLTELTSSVNRTSGTVGQSVYVLNTDGSKVGVNVIQSVNTTKTSRNRHSAIVTIEYPETFLQ